MSPPTNSNPEDTSSSVPHATSKQLSVLRTRILEEAKTAKRGIRKKAKRTWTKKHKYGRRQSTLDLDAGMKQLRPSRPAQPDVQSLSPEDFGSSHQTSLGTTPTNKTSLNTTPTNETSSSANEDVIPITPPSTGRTVGEYSLQLDQIPEPMDIEMAGLDYTLSLSERDLYIPSYKELHWEGKYAGYTLPDNMSPPNFPQVEEVMDDYFATEKDLALDGFAPIMIEAAPLTEQTPSIPSGGSTNSTTCFDDFTVANGHAADFVTGEGITSYNHGVSSHTSDPIMLELDEMIGTSRMHSDVTSSEHEARVLDGSPLQTPTSTEWVFGSSSKRFEHRTIHNPQHFKTANEARASIPKPRVIDPRWPDMQLYPDCRPISQEQLAAEVKSIYADLIIVESKGLGRYKMVDGLAMCEDSPGFNHYQWRALMALHKTLLHEHHDFYLATLHPSAPPALRQLAEKHGMPARMWKKGIQPILDIFRSDPKGSASHIQDFLRETRQTMKMFHEDLPEASDEWDKIEAALLEFENVVFDLRNDAPYNHPQNSGNGPDATSTSYLQYLQAQTQHHDDDDALEYGDLFLQDPPTPPLDEPLVEAFHFPQHVTDAMMA